MRLANSSAARCSAGVTYFKRAILQAHRVAAQRAPRGDVATHDAGADHVHMRTCGSRPAACRPAPSADPAAGTPAPDCAPCRCRTGRRSTAPRPRRPRGHARRTSPTARRWRRAPGSARVARARPPGAAAPARRSVRTSGQDSRRSSSARPMRRRSPGDQLARGGIGVRRQPRSDRPARACSALSPRMFLPVSIMSMAGRTPISRTRRTVPPKPG